MLDIVYEYDIRKEKIKQVDKCITIAATIMLCIIPLLMYRYDAVSYSPILVGNSYATGERTDVFNFYKTISIIVSSCVLLGLLIHKMVRYNYEIKKTKLNYVVLLFAIAIVLSPIVSKYTDIALYGNVDRYEGAAAWFSYLSIFFVLYNTKIEAKFYKYFYLALIPFIVINLLMSILHLMGVNLLDYEIINNLLGGELSGYLSTTLYHPNFGSAMSAVVFCVSFMYLLLEKNIKIKVLLLITTIASFAMLLAMISSGGFVTTLIVLPILIVMAIRLTNIKNVLVWSGVTLISNCIVYLSLSKLDERVYAESFALISKINGISKFIIPVAIIGFVGIVFILKFVNRKKVFDIVLGLTVVCTLVFGVAASNVIEKEMALVKENPIYQKINEMSTDRINIWMKTIDLINDKPLLGHGFDTLPYVIYEEDEDKGVSTYGEFIDKPHNWYLTVAYGSGLLGLTGLIAILAYIMRGLFYDLSDKIQNKYIYIFGIGVLAYAVQGLSNDSLGGTSIMFWIIAGLCASQLSKSKTN